MASSSSAMNTNPLLEHLEDGKIYDLDLGETWNSMNDGNTSKYAYHTIKCKTKNGLCLIKNSFSFFC